MEVTIGLMFTEPQAKEKCSLAHDSKQVRLLISRSSLSVDIYYNNGCDAVFLSIWLPGVVKFRQTILLLFYYCILP